jgi:hypothetical protein
MARLGVPSRNRGTRRHGWGACARAVADAHMRFGARGCAGTCPTRP